MAEAAAAARALEQELELDDESPWGLIKCPVCLELYSSNPKILPCAHLICERCLISWVTANAAAALCPVCRYDITDETICRLPSTLTADEIAEALPTDVSIKDMVACVKVFDGPHTCVKCNADANSFCMDCFEKFCKKCRRKHSKVTNKIASKAAARMAGGAGGLNLAAASPTSQAKTTADDSEDGETAASPLSSLTVNSSVPYVLPKTHTIEMLIDLTPQRVATGKREKCRDHPGINFRDYFCPAHKKSVCLMCINANHQTCQIITAEEEVENNRQILREQAERLERQEEILKQEEEHFLEKEAEARAMADRTHAEIDAAMDLIQFRLSDEQAKFKKALADASSLPREQRVETQTSLIHAFSNKLKEIVSLQEAEAALHRYEEYSRENVAAIHERTEYLTGRRRDPPPQQPQQPRRAHHHNPNHRHTPRQRRHQHQQAATATGGSVSIIAAQVQTEAASLSSIVDEVTSDLENSILSTDELDDSDAIGDTLVSDGSGTTLSGGDV